MNRAILWRWLNILVLAVAGTITGCLLLGWQPSVCSSAVHLIGEWPCWWQQVALIILGVTVLASLYSRMASFSLDHVPLAHRYPPTWIAILIAAILTFTFQYNAQAIVCSRRYDVATWLWAGTAVILGCATLAIVRLITDWPVDYLARKPRLKPCDEDHTASATQRSLNSIADDWQALKAWFATDLPIEHPSQDVLDRTAIVRRLADRLLAPFDKSITIGLVGYYRSGKTSVIALAQEELHHRQVHETPSVLFCNVDCWGFEDSGAALQNIVSRLVTVLSTKADCLAISRLPEAYRKSLSGGGGWLASLADLIGDSDPTSQLSRLSPILAAMNTRLVLVIEELDRPQSSRFDPQDIVATLWRLKAVRGMSFILTGSRDAKYHMPFAKLCDHIEDLRMDLHPMLRAIRTMRQHSIAEYGDVDPTPPQARDRMDKLWAADTTLDRYVQVSWLGSDDSFSKAVLLLVKTPRDFKLVLRHADVVWQALHGEIDFSDLLVCTILRHTASEAHDFILRQIDLLRMAASTTNSGSNDRPAQRRKERIRADWNKTIENVNWDATAARAILLFLFPDAKDYFGERHVENRDGPQGVRDLEPTDYWRRMVAGEVDPNELRDQSVLKSMVQWSEAPSESNLAISLCSTDRFAKLWEYFDPCFPTPDLLELSGQVLDILRKRDGARASGDRERDGMGALWRRANKTIRKSPDNCMWLLDQIVRSVPISLRLVNDLYHSWASIDCGILTSEQDRNTVRQGLVNEAKQFFTSGQGDAVIGILDPGYPYSILHLVQPVDQQEPPSVVKDPSDWQWLTPILLSAAARAPTLIIPELVYLVTDSERGPRHEVKTHWRQEILEHMFAGNIHRLMEILAEDSLVEQAYPDPSVEATVKNCRELARQWLHEHGESV